MRLMHVRTDEEPFTFAAALQSHVRCADIASAEALGLGGKALLNCDADPDRPRVGLEQEDPTTFGGNAPCMQTRDLKQQGPTTFGGNAPGWERT